jgi:hypothetical protein
LKRAGSADPADGDGGDDAALRSAEGAAADRAGCGSSGPHPPTAMTKTTTATARRIAPI